MASQAVSFESGALRADGVQIERSARLTLHGEHLKRKQFVHVLVAPPLFGS